MSQQASSSDGTADHRQFLSLALPAGGFELEAGGRLPEVVVAFETWGTLNADASNAVLVLHALTGDSHVADAPGSGEPKRGWWPGMVGPGAAIDTDRYFVVCPNVLGGCGGTTGPSSLAPGGEPYGSRFPLLTIRDQVAVEIAFADALGIEAWYAVIGGSMGGARAVEWATMAPGRVKRAVLVATGAAATAEQIALVALQVRAIRADPAFHGGDYYGHDEQPHEGLALARGIGHLSYRSPTELDARFSNAPQADEEPLKGGRFAVQSYLDHHGAKLVNRFDANSYVVLSEAMNLHDVGRGRGGRERALARVEATTTVISINSDRLFPVTQQEELAALIRHAAPVVRIASLVGHDGFLTETESVGDALHRALAG